MLANGSVPRVPAVRDILLNGVCVRIRGFVNRCSYSRPLTAMCTFMWFLRPPAPMRPTTTPLLLPPLCASRGLLLQGNFQQLTLPDKEGLGIFNIEFSAQGECSPCSDPAAVVRRSPSISLT